MRVLIWTSSFLPFRGGLETVTETLATNLRRLNHEVQIVTNRYPLTLTKKENIDGLLVNRFLFYDLPSLEFIPKQRMIISAGGLLLGKLGMRQMRRFLRSFQPDVINVHFPEPISWLLEMEREIKCRLVVSLHGSDVEQFGKQGLDKKKLSRLQTLLRRADTVTACSGYLLNQAMGLEPSIKQKGKVIYNGVDLNLFKEKTTYDHFKPYIFSYGRLIHIKGFDLLIEAFANVRKKYLDIKLVLAGEGTERNNLFERVTNLGLKESVTFYGKASMPEIVRLLNGCEFVVIPSRREGFGMAAVESMAAGKLVLATKAGGLPEILQNSHNILVEPMMVSAIQSGLEQCLALKEKSKIGMENRKLSEAYSADTMVSKYINTYLDQNAPHN